VLVTHAHGDHYGDAVALAKKGGKVVSNYEIVNRASSEGAQTVGMNTGGTLRFKGGWLKWYPAWHSSSFSDGSYGGNPMGVLLELGGKRIYHSGDTALFSDLGLLARHGIDLALVCIGDHFTMGPDDALEALQLMRAKQTIPIHYNTFPPIAQDGPGFVRRAGVLGIGGKALEPGERYSL
jgi:L-ascorbate metabolism protein UlaG (beta-lactamase superfamily)